MPFKLSRGGNNIPAEVQRWQFFLLRQGVLQVGKVDADFGAKTEEATKIFQLRNSLSTSGKLDDQTLTVAGQKGYTILANDYYSSRKGIHWPAAPENLQSPDQAWRNDRFTCFNFIQKKLQFRDRPERIVIRGSCDATVADWTNNFIVDAAFSEFDHVEGYNGYLRVHKECVTPLKELFAEWAAQDLLHLILSCAGAFDPRYIFGKSPGDGAQPERSSRDEPNLSNHSFGAAIDINATWNWIGTTPAECGRKGSIRELVVVANQLGFYWGGHYKHRLDGMHLELAR